MLIRRTGEMITHMQSRNDVEQVEKVKVDDEHLLDYLEGLYNRQDLLEKQINVRFVLDGIEEQRRNLSH